jgi:hypothetical protein
MQEKLHRVTWPSVMNISIVMQNPLISPNTYVTVAWWSTSEKFAQEYQDI